MKKILLLLSPPPLRSASPHPFRWKRRGDLNILPIPLNLCLGLSLSLGFLTAQTVPDTVVVPLAHSSQMVFTVQDRNDIATLKQYDFQALFNDILHKLETRDSTGQVVSPAPAVSPSVNDNQPMNTSVQPETGSQTEKIETHEHHHRFPWSNQFFNFDFGLNNYLKNGKFPDVGTDKFSVHPWGSWYIGLNTVQRTRFSNVFNVEWSLGVSWYNFKFDDDDTWVTRNENGVMFTSDPRNLDFTKSKLTVTYLNASIIPMFAWGKGYGHYVYKHSCQSGFRIGAGPYVGYRLGSYAKQQYKVNGDKESDRDRDPFYLNNLRYGLRLQFGFRTTDFFIQYDLNKLFDDQKGPELNAYSFGVVF